jgi:hypothetical protein
MPHYQSTPRKDSARGAAVARRLIAASTIDPRILEATIFVPGLAGERGEVKHLRAGRSYVVNGLEVKKGDMTVLVQSSAAPGRWFVCHNHQWSVKDERIVAKLRKLILAQAA